MTLICLRENMFKWWVKTIFSRVLFHWELIFGIFCFSIQIEISDVARRVIVFLQNKVSRSYCNWIDYVLDCILSRFFSYCADMSLRLSSCCAENSSRFGEGEADVQGSIWNCHKGHWKRCKKTEKKKNQNKFTFKS